MELMKPELYSQFQRSVDLLNCCGFSVLKASALNAVTDFIETCHSNLRLPFVIIHHHQQEFKTGILRSQYSTKLKSYES